MSRIIDFYLGKLKHSRGATIDAIWKWSSGQLEFQHTYVQWLFPLVERSRSEPDSPILSDKDIERFNTNTELRERLKNSFRLLLGFYGFQLGYEAENSQKPSIGPSERFEERTKRWLNANNHNYLRITRILKSLTILGMSNEATEFFAALQRVYVQNGGKIGSYTYEYWKNAVRK